MQPSPAYGQEVLDQFPPELHPVVQQFGPEMVGYCCTMVGLNGALTFLGQRLAQHVDLVQALQHIKIGAQMLSDNLTRASAWDGPRLVECYQDVARARMLTALDTKQKAGSGKIILPN